MNMVGKTDSQGATPDKILLVDDDDAVRTVTGEILRRAGFSVIDAASGPEALALFKHYKADMRVVVSDVVMPGMPGPTLAEQLLVLQPRLRVLFISGYVMGPPSRLKLNSHNVAFLAKPFVGAQLVAKVKELIAQSAAPVTFES